MDLEFLAQYLQLIHGATHPDLLNATTRAVFKQAGALGVLAADRAARLADAASFWLALQGLLRLTLDDASPSDEDLSADLRVLLARAGRAADFGRLKTKMDDVADLVLAAYNAHIGQSGATPPTPEQENRT